MKKKVFKIELLGLVTIVLLCFLFLGFKNNLPKIFVIGDSISMHYGPCLEKSLTGFLYMTEKEEVKIAR